MTHPPALTVTPLDDRDPAVLVQWSVVHQGAAPCFLELMLHTGTLSVVVEHGPADWMPPAVRDGHALRWAIPHLTARDANALLERAAPYAARVLAGTTITAAGLDTDIDAHNADDDLAALIKGRRGEVIRWYTAANLPAEAFAAPITGASTDDDLAALATVLRNDFYEQGEAHPPVFFGLMERLTALRAAAAGDERTRLTTALLAELERTAPEYQRLEAALATMRARRAEVMQTLAGLDVRHGVIAAAAGVARPRVGQILKSTTGGTGEDTSTAA